MEITIKGKQGEGKSSAATVIAEVLRRDGYVVRVQDDGEFRLLRPEAGAFQGLRSVDIRTEVA